MYSRFKRSRPCRSLVHSSWRKLRFWSPDLARSSSSRAVGRDDGVTSFTLILEVLPPSVGRISTVPVIFGSQPDQTCSKPVARPGVRILVTYVRRNVERSHHGIGLVCKVSDTQSFENVRTALCSHAWPRGFAVE